MSDQLENFIRNNREQFDQVEPNPELWTNIEAGLGATIVGSTAVASSAVTTKTGLAAKLASLSTAWKAVAAIVTVAAITTAVVISSNPGNENEPPSTQSSLPLASDSGGKPSLTAAPPLVNPPMEEADVEYKYFKINATKGGSWQAKTGTTLNIPMSAFVDTNGKPVNGEVTIRYREFHDAADIILSGITMKYNDQGQLEDFQTAGMMEIRGTQAGNPVFIASGKSLQIDLASFTEEDDYALYYLDEEKGWADIGKAAIRQNKKKEKGIRINTQKAPKPRKPINHDQESSYKVAVDVNYDEFPELKPFKKVQWEAIDHAYFDENQWALTKRWNDVSLSEIDGESNIYKLIFSNRKGKFELKVAPALQGKDYEKALAKFNAKMDAYNQKLVEKQAELNRFGLQANIFRSFQISGFGIYNCDRFLKMTDAITFSANIQFPKGMSINPEATLFYHISGDNRAVVTRSFEEMSRFSFSPKESNHLVTILPGNKIGLFSTEDFESIDLDKAAAKKEYTLNIQQLERQVHDATDLRLVLGI